MSANFSITVWYKNSSHSSEEFDMSEETFKEIFDDKKNRLEKISVFRWIPLHERNGREFFLNMDELEKFQINYFIDYFFEHRGYKIEYFYNSFHKKWHHKIVCPDGDDQAFMDDIDDVKDSRKTVKEKFIKWVDDDLLEESEDDTNSTISNDVK